MRREQPPEPTPPDPGDVPDELQASDEFAEMLAEAGYRDVLVLARSSAVDALGGKRRELIEYLREHEPASVRAAARELDRNVSNVSGDLTRLSELGIVEYVDGPRGAKAPRLKHRHVVVEPIV